jgi:hypothetical protein
MEARADGDPIYYLLLLTDIVDGFFSPKTDFFLEALPLTYYL